MQMYYNININVGKQNIRMCKSGLINSLYINNNIIILMMIFLQAFNV